TTSSETAAASRHPPCAPTVDVVATRPSLVRTEILPWPIGRGQADGRPCEILLINAACRVTSVALLLQIIQRPAAKRSEARAEDQSGVGEVRVRDDAFGDDRARLAQIRRHELDAQIRRNGTCGSSLRLAVLPRIEAVPGLAPEVARGDEFGE